MDAFTMTNFEGRFFDQLVEDAREIKSGMKEQSKKLEKIHEQTVKTNSRVDKLEAEVFGKVKPSDLSPAWKDPKVIQVVFLIALSFVLLVAAVTKVDIRGIL